MAKKGPFKMKGHTLPGINQRSETKNMGDGRSKSSAFQANTAAAGAKAGKGALAGGEKFGAINQLKQSKFGKDLKGLDNKLQDFGKKHSKWKADRMSKSNINIKDKMGKKYGTGDYARGGSKANQRMKAGESQYKYDIRMKKQANKFRKNDPLLREIKDTSELKVGEGIKHGPKNKPNVATSKPSTPKSSTTNLDKMSFGDAFKSSRKSGAKEFTWKGKKYHTKTKSEMSGNKTKTYPKNSPSNPKNFSTGKSGVDPKTGKFRLDLGIPGIPKKKKAATKKKKSPAKNYKKGYYGA